MVRWGDLPELSYPLGTVTANRAAVARVEHRSSRACPSFNTINIGLEGNAIAYRFAWADGTSTVAPADSYVFWSTFQSEAAPPPQLIQLGYRDCLGHTVDPDRFATLREFQLYALFADGSEQPLGAASAMLRKGGVRLPYELLPATARRLHEEAESEVPLAEQHGWWWLPRGGLLWLLWLSGALLVLLLHRLRHRRRDHVPRY